MNYSLGVRYMVLAIFFFSLMNLCVKFISHIPAVEIVLFRSIISLTISGLFLIKQKVPLFGSNRKILLIRGLTGTIALVAYFITLQKIPLAGAVTIHYMAPIFTTILGILIVKEKVSWLQFLFFLTFLYRNYNYPGSRYQNHLGICSDRFGGVVFHWFGL